MSDAGNFNVAGDPLSNPDYGERERAIREKDEAAAAEPASIAPEPIWQPFPWLPFARELGRESLVHSIMFEDGSVFDAVNGWREGTIYCPRCQHRVGDFGSHS